MSERTKALIEVCSLSLAVLLILWSFEAYLRWLAFWDWYFKALLALVALLSVVLPKRSPRAYGLLPKSSRLTLKWSALVMTVFLAPAAAVVALSRALGFGESAGLSPPRVVMMVTWYMVFVGLAEEVYFRGYAQTRLEEAFGKRWGRFVFRSWRVSYGPGLLLASTIFGAVHVAIYWNPLVPRWEPAWWAPVHVLGAFAFGCLAGALRETSGDVYVPASLHGGLMVAYALLSEYTNLIALNATLFVAWFVFFYTMDSFFREAEGFRTAGASRRG